MLLLHVLMSHFFARCNSEYRNALSTIPSNDEASLSGK